MSLTMCRLNVKQDLCKSSHSQWFKQKVLNFFLPEYWPQIAQYPEVEKGKKNNLSGKYNPIPP